MLKIRFKKSSLGLKQPCRLLTTWQAPHRCPELALQDSDGPKCLHGAMAHNKPHSLAHRSCFRNSVLQICPHHHSAQCLSSCLVGLATPIIFRRDCLSSGQPQSFPEPGTGVGQAQTLATGSALPQQWLYPLCLPCLLSYFKLSCNTSIGFFDIENSRTTRILSCFKMFSWPGFFLPRIS